VAGFYEHGNEPSSSIKPRLTERVISSQEEFCSMELAVYLVILHFRAFTLKAFKEPCAVTGELRDFTRSEYVAGHRVLLAWPVER
jgi:hypothetical protein